LKDGKVSLYIDYYPPVWNPVKKIYSRREFLNFQIIKHPQNMFERKQNEVNREIAEKIYVKRMKDNEIGLIQRILFAVSFVWLCQFYSHKRPLLQM